MSIIVADRVKETTTTTGTGTVDLDGASVGFQGFVAGVGDGAEVYYCIAGQSGGGAAAEWETGIGTVTDAATDTLSRDTVLASSNSGSLVNFASGTKDVFLTMPAQGMPVVVDTQSPSGVGNVDLSFASGFSMFRLCGKILPATDSVNLQLRFDDGGGFDNTNEYAWVFHFSDGTTEDGGSDANTTGIRLGNSDIGNLSTEGISIDLLITDALAARRTWVQGTVVDSKADANRVVFNSYGVHLVASTLDALRLVFSSGNIADGELRLIGIP